MSTRQTMIVALSIAFALAVACSRQGSTITSPTGPSTAVSAGAAADGSTLKATPPTPLSPVNDQAVSDAPTLTASASNLKYGQGALQYRFELFNESGAKVQESGLVASPAFKVTAALDFKKRYTWHARAEYQGAVGPWSATASFVSPEGGYIRGNEVFDPLYNGQSVGDLVGNTSFVADKGIRLNDGTGYVRYLIPQTITAGEFSAEVEGLRANAPGNKSKVFGMQEGQTDFITNRYRVDIQFRGASGSPPNSITFRALYGSADDLSLRYEPDTATRYNSVYNLNPSTTYFWKTTWGNGEFRVTVREGGATGAIIYNQGVPTPRGTYSPSPHYAYLGAPVGRSGDESVSIPGAIYRNVWISARPRP
jgi:hypothetical protein